MDPYWQVFLWIAAVHSEQFQASYGVQRKIDTFEETLSRHDGGKPQHRVSGTPVRGYYVNIEALPVLMIGDLLRLASSRKPFLLFSYIPS